MSPFSSTCAPFGISCTQSGRIKAPGTCTHPGWAFKDTVDAADDWACAAGDRQNAKASAAMDNPARRSDFSFIDCCVSDIIFPFSFFL
jgi:hypothetical protein